jgi:hypothetical protein
MVAAMNTPPPLAARFFYALATVSGMLAFAFLLIALYGADLAETEDWYYLSALTGFWGIVASVEALLAAGFLAAIGAVIHDVRRIAENTSAETLADTFSAALARAPQHQAILEAPDPAAKVEYFYFVGDVEHGPVTRARIRDLIRTKRLTSSQRIERSIDGAREACDPRDFGSG